MIKIIQQGAEAKIILTDNKSKKRAGGWNERFRENIEGGWRGGRWKEKNIRAKSRVRVGGNKIIIKDRISKSYRIPELDIKIRRRRTKSEVKLLTKAAQVINVPTPLIAASPGREGGETKTKLKIPFIDGKKLSEYLDKSSLGKQKQILKQIGEDVAKLHKENIIHGDLTTSNMILVENNKKPEKISLLNKKFFGDGGRESHKTNFKIFFIDFGLGYFNGKYEDKAVDIHLLKQALEAKHFRNWKKLFQEFEKGYKSIDKKETEKVFNQLIKVEKRGRYKQ